MGEPMLDRWVRRQTWLKEASKIANDIVGAIYKPLGKPGRYLKSFLNGTFVLRHSLHAVLTDVPLGAWTVAFAADIGTHFIPTKVPDQVADVSITIGLVGALGAVASGYTDFLDASGHRKRTAILHGLIMTVVTLLYLFSFLLRYFAHPAEPARSVAVGLAAVAYLVLIAGAYIGGHLVFGIGTGVNRNAFHVGPKEYVKVGSAADLAQGSMRRYELEEAAVMVARFNGRLVGMSDICSHEGAPLHEGAFDGDVVVCPWHGSRFALHDGTVAGGPATMSLPAYEVRELEGSIEVKLAAPAND